jgi:hypothetical protein
MKNFKVGKDLTAILLADSTVHSLVGDKVFPLVANAGTTFPFIVYRRNGYRPYSNKDYTDEVAYIELAVLSDNYIDGVQLADAVGNALNEKETETIDEIVIENASEEYNSDTYIQKINLKITIK